jgi:hypothetical protein
MIYKVEYLLLNNLHTWEMKFWNDFMFCGYILVAWLVVLQDFSCLLTDFV